MNIRSVPLNIIYNGNILLPFNVKNNNSRTAKVMATAEIKTWRIDCEARRLPENCERINKKVCAEILIVTSRER